MTRATLLTGVLLGAAATILAPLGPRTGAANADPAPREGTFTPEQLAVARAELERGPRLEPGWEGHVDELERALRRGVPGAAGAPDGTQRGPANGDNSTVHYARGTTLLIHIFINHAGGTWSGEEIALRGARAEVAKDYYRDRMPAGTGLSFDHEDDPGGYYYYEVTVPYTIPAGETCNWTLADDAMTILGYTDTDGDLLVSDEITFDLQDWNGGWDNVVCIYEPMVSGRSCASYGTGSILNYENADATTWAHELGHSFGACDEYSEGGQCNGGIDCGPCQSEYLPATVLNGNCELESCPGEQACLMRDNSFANICPWTWEHWGWLDTNQDGYLDETRRRTGPSSFVRILEMPWRSGYIWNNVTDGYSFRQTYPTWAAVGIRPPSGTDYDLTVYADNNHGQPLASSAYGGSAVDLVVGDYHHSRVGIEHAQVSLWSGATNPYTITWDAGSQPLYPDGVIRPANWDPDRVVRAWDVPLFGGETVSFTLDPSPGQDLGMALFRSNGDVYFAGRSSAVVQADAGGPGATETMSYAIPVDDVYGLVVWSNDGLQAPYSIQIGPSPLALTDDVPASTTDPLGLYSYDPSGGFYWSVVGSRGAPGTGSSLGIFDDASFRSELFTVDDVGAGDLELMALDYNRLPWDTEYVRSVRNAGTGAVVTEWEGGFEVSNGFTGTGSWSPDDAVKVWDTYLFAGETYFFREYHDGSGGIDTEIRLFSPAGPAVSPRAYAAGGVDAFGPGGDGEWFWHTPDVAGWYGIVLGARKGASSSASVWHGPYVDLSDDEPTDPGSSVVFAEAPVEAIYWTAVAVRDRNAGVDDPGLWLYQDPSFGPGGFLGSDQTGGAGVSFVVVDFNHMTPVPLYARTLATGGVGVDLELDGGPDGIIHSPGAEFIETYEWDDGEVIDMIDVYVPGAVGLVDIQVLDLGGTLDLGLAVFASSGGPYVADLSSAVVASDLNGVGGHEGVSLPVSVDDWYGIAIYSKTGAAGTYRLRVADPEILTTDPAGPVVASPLRVAATNPFASRTVLEVGLDEGSPVRVDLFDVGGRHLRTLADATFPAGVHRFAVDGRDGSGQALASGLYLVRLEAGDRRETVKLVKSR